MRAQLRNRFEVVLDNCIDRLLIGQDWHDLEPADSASKKLLASLMRIAGLLLRLARRAPTVTSERLDRIWRKTNDLLKAEPLPGARMFPPT